jgi:hypothetical protein
MCAQRSWFGGWVVLLWFEAVCLASRRHRLTTGASEVGVCISLSSLPSMQRHAMRCDVTCDGPMCACAQGVGSHAAHLLLRSGVGRLRLIDFDQVANGCPAPPLSFLFVFCKGGGGRG